MGPAQGTGRRDAEAIEPRRVVVLVVVLGLLIGLGVWRHRAATEGGIHDFSGATMGTTWSARIDADLSSSGQDEARRVIQERLDSVSRLMSTYDSASEVSRFNRHLGTDPVRVSPELIEVLGMAREVSERSGGAFDVTVAPYVDAWGFGPSEPRAPPDDAELAALRPRVGYDLLVLDTVEGTLAKKNPATTIDLSAIAKGYAADQVASALRSLGLESFLVEVGGELRAVGARRDGRAWRVGVERPDEGGSGYAGTVDLRDEGIATSGDYRNYRESDGVTYAHIIDPRTGQPVRVRHLSVTVVQANAAMADAWATALTVLGPDRGYDLARSVGLPAAFVLAGAEGPRPRVTPALGDRFVVGDAGR
jgi:FAD:protein FMN transferase